MKDLAASIVQKLDKGLFSQASDRSASIAPSYTGYSVLNLPGSLFRWFELPDLPHPPLQIQEMDQLAKGIDQIILLLLDAVAYDRMLNWLQSEPGLQPFLQDGLLVPLTSVTPCTTCNVLTTLWSGRSPVEHAVLGYELFLKEYGLVANMITHSPMALGHQAGLLYQAGFDPESVLPVDTIGPALDAGGVDVHSFLHYSISNSGLSRMHYQNVERHAFGGAADLWIAIRRLAEEQRKRRRFIWVYHGAIDGLSHRFGPDSEQAEAEFKAFLQTLQTNFLAPLSTQGRKRTLFLITADHGQVTTPKNPDFELVNHPEFMDMLHIAPTGENRFIYLHPKPGMTQAVQDYFQHAWPGQFHTLPASEALNTGIFGPGVPDKSVPDRIGDVIAIPTNETAYLWWSRSPNPLLGRHGAFHPLEMLVPLLAMRLG